MLPSFNGLPLQVGGYGFREVVNRIMAHTQLHSLRLVQVQIDASAAGGGHSSQIPMRPDLMGFGHAFYVRSRIYDFFLAIEVLPPVKLLHISLIA